MSGLGDGLMLCTAGVSEWLWRLELELFSLESMELSVCCSSGEDASVSMCGVVGGGGVTAWAGVAGARAGWTGAGGAAGMTGVSSSVSESVSLSRSCCLWNQGFVGLQGCCCGVGWSLGWSWLVWCSRSVTGGLCSSWSRFGSVRYSLLMILESELDRGCRIRCIVTFSFCAEVTKYMSRALCLGCDAMGVTVSPVLMIGL